MWALLHDFRQHNESYNALLAQSKLAQIFADLRDQLKMVLVLNADKTLAAEDAPPSILKTVQPRGLLIAKRPTVCVSVHLRGVQPSRTGAARSWICKTRRSSTWGTRGPFMTIPSILYNRIKQSVNLAYEISTGL